jgi:microcompartment protein CcmL/EutN
MVTSGDALGIVEVEGMTAALAVADAMVKAAPVTLSGPASIGDGLVDWFVHGSIAAVEEAVAVADRVFAGSLRSVAVIGRPDLMVVEIFVAAADRSGGAATREEGWLLR